MANNVAPRLRGLPYAKIVVYGYTDNTPVGPELQRAGINDNLTLSSRRAGAVVTFLISQGIKPEIISAKGFGDTHPVAPNDLLAGEPRQEPPHRDHRPGRRRTPALTALPARPAPTGPHPFLIRHARTCSAYPRLSFRVFPFPTPPSRPAAALPPDGRSRFGS